MSNDERQNKIKFYKKTRQRVIDLEDPGTEEEYKEKIEGLKKIVDEEHQRINRPPEEELDPELMSQTYNNGLGQFLVRYQSGAYNK